MESVTGGVWRDEKGKGDIRIKSYGKKRKETKKGNKKWGTMDKDIRGTGNGGSGTKEYGNTGN